MEIKNSLQKLVDPYAQQVQKNTQATQQRAATQGQASLAQGGDRVSVSPEAKLYTEAFAAASGAPDIRQEKVNSLKEKVQNGTYTPNSRDIAEKMLKNDAELVSSLKG